MNATELSYTSATDLARLIRSKDISPREIVNELLDRIDEINPRINAYCTIAAEQALRAAEDAASLEKAAPWAQRRPPV